MRRGWLFTWLVFGCDAAAINTHRRELNGDLGNWSTTASLLQAKSAHGSASANGYIYAIGGLQDTNEVEMAHPDPITGAIPSWSTAQQLPERKAGIAVATFGGYVYVISGTSSAHASNVSSDILYSQIQGDGTLGSWSMGGQIPQSRRGASAAAWNGYLYVAGGGTGGSCCFNTVFYAQIGSNGAPGSWSTSTMPQSVLRSVAVAYNGHLYIIGGIGGVSPPAVSLNTIMHAPLGANGAPGTWATDTAPWTRRRDHTAVASNGYLYVIGGTSSNNHPGTSELPDVWKAPINGDGSLGQWATTSALSNPRRSMTAVVSGSYIYSIGGANGNASNSSNRTTQVVVAQVTTAPPPDAGGSDGSAGAGGASGAGGSAGVGGAGGNPGPDAAAGTSGNPVTGERGFEGCACRAAGGDAPPTALCALLALAVLLSRRGSRSRDRRALRARPEPDCPGSSSRAPARSRR